MTWSAGSTGIVEVDTDALNRLAERIRQAAAEAHSATTATGPLQLTIGGLVTPCLVQAVGTFVGNWSSALTDLVAEANRLADAIALAARSYQDTESLASRTLQP